MGGVSSVEHKRMDAGGAEKEKEQRVEQAPEKCKPCEKEQEKAEKERHRMEQEERQRAEQEEARRKEKEQKAKKQSAETGKRADEKTATLINKRSREKTSKETAKPKPLAAPKKSSKEKKGSKEQSRPSFSSFSSSASSVSYKSSSLKTTKETHKARCNSDPELVSSIEALDRFRPVFKKNNMSVYADIHTRPRPIDGLAIIGGNSNRELLELITDQLGAVIADITVVSESGRESYIMFNESVRNKHVVIFQSSSMDVNTHLMELLILIYTCKTSHAQTITVVCPYLPYSRQSKVRRRSALPMKLVADMICKAGAHRLVTMDMFKKEIRGFFNIPVENIRASAFLIQWISRLPAYKTGSCVIVARTPEMVAKATSYAERLKLPHIALLHGDPQLEDKNQSVDITASDEKSAGGSAKSKRKESTEPARRQYIYDIVGFPRMGMFTKEKYPLTVVGDVRGLDAVIVDDVIHDIKPFAIAAAALKKKGANRVYVVASHGAFDKDVVKDIDQSMIDQIAVTNTVVHAEHAKITTVDVSPLLAECIRRTHYAETMAALFVGVAIDANE